MDDTLRPVRAPAGSSAQAGKAIKGELEQKLRQSYGLIAGVDEVGRGCIAGPVYGGCVVLDYDRVAALAPQEQKLLRDSKTLSAKQRAEAVAIIAHVSVAAEVGHATVREIEQLGIVPGAFLAMARAFRAVYDETVSRSMILVDGKAVLPHNMLPSLQPQQGATIDQQAIVKGDSSCFAIAAASIIAKQARDAVMIEAASQYPAYGFADHVGYGTKAHRDALAEVGYCPLHRRNFAPIRGMVEAEQG